MNESTTITIDNIAKLIKGIAETEYQRGYVAGLEEKRLTDLHWGKNQENAVIKDIRAMIAQDTDIFPDGECYIKVDNKIEEILDKYTN